MPPSVSPNNVTDKEAPPRSAASPWAVIAALIVGAISAVLGLPEGSPPVLFQIFLMSICCAVLLFAVAVVPMEFSRTTTCVPHQQTTLNLPLCITFLESMACCFLLIAFFSAAFILHIGHASGARIRVFFPTLLLFLLLLISFWCAYRIAIHIPAEKQGNSTASDPHKDVPSDLENQTLP